jgi:hypothetical protein
MGGTMIKRAWLILVALVWLSTAPVMGAEAADLTGVWRTSGGVTFYVRQLGNEIWWFGQQAPTNPRWTNVAQGMLVGDLVQVKWVDVPMGGTRHQGSLALRVVEPDHLKVVENPNDFWSADWYRK